MMDYSKHINRKLRFSFRFYFVIGFCLFIVFYLKFLRRKQNISNDISNVISVTNSVKSIVNIIDPNKILISNFTCIKTKTLFGLYRTTICIHDGKDYVSTVVAQAHIWEEESITRILRILVKNPHLDMIDIGANIGGYTMFTAGALGRFTLSVDGFMPNIERIARAVLIENISNRVVLVHNALYSKSGEYVQLLDKDPSGMQLAEKSDINSSNQYIVKTIQFDDLLPILIQRGVQSAIIKIDIEGSEIYLCETGSKIFSLIDIQLVMMEWNREMRKIYQKQYQKLIDCFTQMNYITTDETCEPLNVENWKTKWPGNVYWIKQKNFRQNIC